MTATTKITYTSASGDLAEFHRLFDQALSRVRAAAGGRHPFYIDGEPVAAIVYQRRKHVINLFVAQHLGARRARTASESIQGYNVRHWSQDGLDFWAVSDLASPPSVACPLT